MKIECKEDTVTLTLEEGDDAVGHYEGTAFTAKFKPISCDHRETLSFENNDQGGICVELPGSPGAGFESPSVLWCTHCGAIGIRTPYTADPSVTWISPGRWIFPSR